MSSQRQHSGTRLSQPGNKPQPTGEITSWQLLDWMLRPFLWLIVIGATLFVAVIVLAILWELRWLVLGFMGFLIAVVAFSCRFPEIANRPVFGSTQADNPPTAPDQPTPPQSEV